MEEWEHLHLQFLQEMDRQAHFRGQFSCWTIDLCASEHRTLPLFVIFNLLWPPVSWLTRGRILWTHLFITSWLCILITILSSVSRDHCPSICWMKTVEVTTSGTESKSKHQTIYSYMHSEKSSLVLTVTLSVPEVVWGFCFVRSPVFWLAKILSLAIRVCTGASLSWWVYLFVCETRLAGFK